MVLKCLSVSSVWGNGEIITSLITTSGGEIVFFSVQLL